ncbi:hypothetical protein DFH11DRAFT_1690728 [Phellopilus nigrolimitatus]|nr:hypothetical protein DFH11DRAFT_1690728 [Phellopilus nigrolimitatus]
MSWRPCIVRLFALNTLLARRAGALATRRVEQRVRPILGSRSFTKTLQERNASIVKQMTESRALIDGAVQARNAEDLCSQMARLRKLFYSLPLPMRPQLAAAHLQLTRAHIGSIVSLLSKRGKEEDVEIVAALLQDCRNIYKSLFRPNSAHWLVVMKGLAQLGDVEKLKECLHAMKNGWPFPRSAHYRALLEGMFLRAERPSAAEIIQVLDEMQSINLPYDKRINALLANVEKQNKDEWRGLSADYRERRRPTITSVEMQSWTEALAKVRTRGKSPFEERLRLLRMKGFAPDERVLAKLPSAARATALEAYRAAKNAGIQPDATMLHPLLRALCTGHVQEPPEQQLDEALALYKDLSDTIQPANNLAIAKDAQPTTGMGAGADTAVYNTLLRALAASANTRKYFPTALALLTDMRTRRVDMDPMTATSITVLLVRSASSFEEAVDAYNRVRGVAELALDQKGFAAVLHALCALEVQGADDGSAPAILPAHAYFQVVADMRAQGYRKTPEVYTILLGRYAALATRAQRVPDARTRARLRSALLDVVDETHRQFTLDAGLAPDAPLLNQLMDAYNRAGSVSDAAKVWGILRSAGLVTHASVSIIFDACGHNGAPGLAKDVFGDLQRAGFVLNRRNWNAWVECLCRLGHLDDALRVVRHDMANDHDSAVHPDKQTSGREEDVRSYVKLYLPRLAELAEVTREN